MVLNAEIEVTGKNKNVGGCNVHLPHSPIPLPSYTQTVSTLMSPIIPFPLPLKPIKNPSKPCKSQVCVLQESIVYVSRSLQYTNLQW